MLILFVDSMNIPEPVREEVISSPEKKMTKNEWLKLLNESPKVSSDLEDFTEGRILIFYINQFHFQNASQSVDDIQYTG